jgi:hypothetical protein
MDIVSQVHEQIQAVARPLYDRLLALDQEIGTREVELAQLRKLRTQLRGAIKNIEPSLLPEEEKPKKRKDTNAWTPKPEKVAAMQEFLVARIAELNSNGGFHAAGLQANYPKELPIAYSSIHKVLTALHEQGAIRLHGTGSGGAKFYKVIA